MSVFVFIKNTAAKHTLLRVACALGTWLVGSNSKQQAAPVGRRGTGNEKLPAFISRLAERQQRATAGVASASSVVCFLTCRSTHATHTHPTPCPSGRGSGHPLADRALPSRVQP
jgi:hypothetical protein